ncbi:hypothetical protein SPRG_07634 [Saprolegnia parasitica CBS 223.65]|uniref:Uncharacterized protein n=1 Tax=Saprolegnia parasitica (strain CBS 223.65) TaxID=695850 RepID=A0A067CCK6_SAPPC|nr:hypothetical protein SPRG_07634 [Saprolegnia parasitica CBS 223.65]KDO26920.1 hypothetical protein SPRG_07634 [Saprolegnia parasitica CBS 223.65]|eukprot:XP_012202302.1 hypothetical protein SPRG_07634 [Saprolegnia parasitica CBS 223.65]
MAAPSATAAALHCNGILIAIVQCIASSCEVVAFLDVLPHSVLGKPLRALHALLSRPGPSLYEWPKPSFLGLVGDEEALLHAALHVYEAIGVYNVHGFGPKFATVYDTAPFCAFASTWAHKITLMDMSISTEPLDEAVCHALRQCTRLREVWLDVSPMTTLLFQAVTTPAHRVRKMHVQSFRDEAFDWTPLLTSWLATGHANHLSVSEITPPNDDLARAIASTLSLRGHELYGCDDFVQQLFSLGQPLRHLTHVRLQTDVPAHIATLLQRVDVRRLESLMLASRVPLDPLVQYLHAAPLLEELDLCRCSLTTTNEHVVGTWPRLRIARFDDVGFRADVFKDVLVHLSTSDRLEHVSFTDCHIVRTEMAAMSAELRVWIENGLRSLTLRGNILDDACVALIAQVLGETENTAPLTQELTENDYTISCVWGMLAALANSTCVNVVMDLEEDISERDMDMIAKVAASYGIKAVLTECHLEMYSSFAIA